MTGFKSKQAMSESRWIATLEEDGDDLVLPLPQELLDELDWKPGDTLNWVEQDNGTWTLRKKV